MVNRSREGLKLQKVAIPLFPSEFWIQTIEYLRT
jgi:hypothetical protein